jgi:hypothetical protein
VYARHLATVHIVLPFSAQGARPYIARTCVSPTTREDVSEVFEYEWCLGSGPRGVATPVPGECKRTRHDGKLEHAAWQYQRGDKSQARPVTERPRRSQNASRDSRMLLRRKPKCAAWTLRSNTSRRYCVRHHLQVSRAADPQRRTAVDYRKDDSIPARHSTFRRVGTKRTQNCQLARLPALRAEP